MGENLDDLGYGDAFLDTTPKTWFMKEITDKLGFIKIKNFCSVKDNTKRIKREATDWEEPFVKDTCDKGLWSKICKELLKFNKKNNDLIKQWAKKTWTDISPKKLYRWQVSIRKDAPHHMSLGKCKLKQQWNTTD